MKVGDKVYCIKEFGEIFFIGMEYKIFKIAADIIYVTFDGVGVCYFYISVYLPSYFYRSLNFSEYFVTVKEGRKLKLDKINEKG